jgi:hypothetical protein
MANRSEASFGQVNTMGGILCLLCIFEITYGAAIPSCRCNVRHTIVRYQDIIKKRRKEDLVTRKTVQYNIHHPTVFPRASVPAGDCGHGGADIRRTAPEPLVPDGILFAVLAFPPVHG